MGTAYREVVRDLAVWCQDPTLSINVIKTKEMSEDYRKKRTEHAPFLIDGAVVEQAESFKFLGVHITKKLEWFKHTKTVVKRSRQSLFPLRRLKRIGMASQIRKKSYSCNIESMVEALPGMATARQGTTEGSAYGPVHHWGQASCHPGPLYQAVSEEGPKNCLTPATLVIDGSLCYRMASGTGAPSLGQNTLKLLLTPIHKTAEHLIKWLPRLFALLPSPLTLLLLCYYLSLSHFNYSTHMYKLP